MRKQIRKLILEGYRELHRQQSRGYKSGEVGGVSGPISMSPSVRYYSALRTYLYHDQGINSDRNAPGSFDYTLNNGHDLNVAKRRSWPHGFSLIRQTLWNATMSSGSGLGTYSINFSVTGNPEIDAEFIARLCALSDDDFLRMGDKTRNAPRIGSWESEIIPGYPHKFIGL